MTTAEASPAHPAPGEHTPAGPPSTPGHAPAGPPSTPGHAPTPGQRGTGAAPELFHALFDDAALFPPAEEPLAQAVRAHLVRRAGGDAVFAGPFLCAAARWPDLLDVLSGSHSPLGPAPLGPSPLGHLPPSRPLDLVLVVAAGPSAVPAAVTAVTGEGLVALRGVEVPVDGSPAALADVLAVLAGLPPSVVAAVEVPIGPAVAMCAAALAGTRHRLKLRTGGLRAESFPSETALAEALHTCVRAGVPVKLTAGLHSAVRHRDARTGFEHHGFLNVLLAVAAAVRGAPVHEVTDALAQTDVQRLSRDVRALDAPTARLLRQSWTSFGTCSTDEPLADLRALGLLA